MQRFGMMTRVIGVALGVVIAIAAVASASAQQEPAHTYYGLDGTPGDEIAVTDSMGEELGSTTVAEGGQWSIEIDRDEADDVLFTLNGQSAEADITNRGEGLDEVSLTAMAMEDDTSMDEGDAMEGGDELEGDGDGMEELEGEGDSMEGDSMEGDDDKMTEYPDTGTGGLADGSVSAGLIGLLIALAAAAAAGLGLRRVRNRA